MRYLKGLIMAVLIYIALYLPFVVVMQTLTGFDYTAAYTIGGAISALELALGGVIKVVEERETAKINKASKDAESEHK